MPKSAILKPILTVAEIERFSTRNFRNCIMAAARMAEQVGPMSAKLRMTAHESHLRPGGTCRAAAMFTLADVGL